MQEELGKSELVDHKDHLKSQKAGLTCTNMPQMDEMKESKRLAAEEKRKNAKPWF
jgi:hypothetical protein